MPLRTRLGLLFMAYSPLGRGFLSGAIESAAALEPNDFRRMHPRFQADNIRHNAILLQQLAVLAQRLDCTLAQLALAWLLHQPWPVLPIVGAHGWPTWSRIWARRSSTWTTRR